MVWEGWNAIFRLQIWRSEFWRNYNGYAAKPINANSQRQRNEIDGTDLLTHSVFTLFLWNVQFYMKFITHPENITLVCESQWYELMAPAGDFEDRNSLNTFCLAAPRGKKTHPWRLQKMLKSSSGAGMDKLHPGDQRQAVKLHSTVRL